MSFACEHYVRAANVGQFLNDLLEFSAAGVTTNWSRRKSMRSMLRGWNAAKPSVPRVAKSKDQLSDAEVIARCQEIARVFATTEKWLREENLGTFGHMITRAHELLTSDGKLLAAERARARFILVDEFQDANFAQIEILASAGGRGSERLRCRRSGSGHLPFSGSIQRGVSAVPPAFSSDEAGRAGQEPALDHSNSCSVPLLVVDKNPPVFAASERAFAYRRTPLQSAREEEASKEGKPLATFPVEAVSFAARDAEAPDVVRIIEETKRRLRCKWKDFGVLYRSHIHRDDVVQQLAEREIPFSIENMDVSDTPEVRDLFACVAVVVDLASDANLFRVAALPQFNVDPEQLRAALRAIAKDSKEGVVVPLASVLDGVAGGLEVLESVRQARDEVNRRKAKARAALQLIGKQFRLDLNSAILQAALKFAADWEEKRTTKTKELGEWIEYLSYFREAGGVIPLASKEDEDAVRLMTAHGAKGLEFSHVFILRATSGSFPTSYRETLVEFPRELRDPDSAAAGDDKTLNDQEERRLFYVAMTRAKDSLHIYGKQGIGRDKTPAGLMRELIGNPGLATLAQVAAGAAFAARIDRDRRGSGCGLSRGLAAGSVA